jgi:hypothetical protein
MNKSMKSLAIACALVVDFMSVTREGLVAVYQHGIEKGKQFARQIKNLSLL